MDLKKLNSNEISDFRNLIEIFKGVFENADEVPNDHHLAKLLSNQDFVVFVVKIDNKVVGGLTLYVLRSYYNVKPMAYIYDVGIATNYQGRGLGKALIAKVCDFCDTSGFEDAFVQAEDSDTDAIDFYRKTNPTNEMMARHFTYSFQVNSRKF
ncbi:MAG: GNAT family N-acetyltransferase [Cyclobacteriaceae bacterium]|jgi:aminoglycoside 3-N-acetyltransferase I